ncbi:MAG TPA: DUF2058 domain-containing protein [Gammaproteobacteria bacterium]|nr:DUF2058 domain-containing protein [Gammaproteobacteria bacterium]
MRNALQEQLLKAGLVKDKQVKEAQKHKHQAQRQQPAKHAQQPTAAQRQAQAAQQQKAARDKALNAEREARAARKALDAQILQLVQQHRRPHNDGDEAYSFVDGSRVKRIYVTAPTREALARGEFGIVRLRNRYFVVTAEGAAAVRERGPDHLVVLNQDAPAAEDAAYAEHPIPDDLMW